MQTLQNGVEVFTNGDAYNLADDTAHAFDTANITVLVPNAAARDALDKYDGLTVRRLDLTGRPTEVWDGDKWVREPYIVDGAPVNDGFWTITGGLMKTTTAGLTQVTSSIRMTRTTAAITINTSDSALLIGFIPVGFRPSTNHYFLSTINTNTGARYGEPQFVIGEASNGTLVGRSVSGGPITVGVGYTMYLSTSWFI